VSEASFPVPDDFTLGHVSPPEPLTVQRTPEKLTKLRYYDTVDDRLLAAACVLEAEGDSATLAWRSLNGKGLLGRLPTDDASIYDPDALAAPRLTRMLDGEPVYQRLVLISRREAGVVLDQDGKAVARVRVDRPKARAAKDRSVKLAPRLIVEAVRGYEQTASEVIAALAEQFGRSPDKQPLYARALQAVAAERPALDPVMPAHLAIARLAEAELRQIARRRAMILAGDKPQKAVHQFRVALRKSRTLMRLGRPVFGPVKPFEHGFRDFGRTAAPVRDLDVLIAALPGWAVETGTDLSRLQSRLAKRRAAAWPLLVRQLADPATQAMIDRWQAFLATPPSPIDPPAQAYLGLERVACARLLQSYRRVRKQGRKIKADSPPEALHDLRKRGKELQYGLTLFAPLWPDDRVRPFLAPVKDMQRLLGLYQDATVQQAMIAALPKSARAGLSPLQQRLQDQAAAARQGFAAAFTRLDEAKPAWQAAFQDTGDDL